MTDYGAKDYWEDRYTKESYVGSISSFEWYQNFESLFPHHNRWIPHREDQKILNVGCGNSLFGERLFTEGYGHIFNIDFSDAVIDTMNRRTELIAKCYKEPYEENKIYLPTGERVIVSDKWKDPSRLVYQSMDATSLKFEDSQFEIVFEKGTTDALSCGDDASEMIGKMCEEIYRTLKDGGIFIAVTYGSPKNRVPYFVSENYPWKLLEQKVIPGLGDEGPGNEDFMYVFQK